MRFVVALCLMLLPSVFAAAPAAAAECDRECLRGKVSEVLYALVDHDVSKLSVAAGRISGYSLFGAGWIVVQGAVHETVVGSGPFEQFSRALLGLVHYR